MEDLQQQPNTTAMTPREENEWAMFCHLGGLAGYVVPFGNILGPLVLWLMKKDQSPLVDKHGKDALNFHISIMIYTLVCIPLCIVLIGFPLLIMVSIGSLVYTILAAVKANNGEHLNYPMTIRFIK
jgi:hypothetical protein